MASVLSRLGVLAALLVAALIDDTHGRGASHWIMLAGYGLVTAGLLGAGRFKMSGTVRRALPVLVALVDALLAGFVGAQHVPRNAVDAHHATEAASLLPAFLLLLQTGTTLRPRAVVVFSVGVLAIWAAASSPVLLLGALGPVEGPGAVSRTLIEFTAFGASAVLVVGAVMWTNHVIDSAVRRGTRLARFVPRNLAADLARDRDVAVTERHAAVISVDLRGFSLLTREYGHAEIVEWLLRFRRSVHDAVTANEGIVDKYVGDGVLALFLEGGPGQQARQAVMAARRITDAISTWNLERRGTDAPQLRVAISLHSGPVLAGVFDDGRRAEYTVLGPTMNALARIEACAKQADAEVVASTNLVELIPALVASHFTRMQPLVTATECSDVPQLLALSFVCPAPGQVNNDDGTGRSTSRQTTSTARYRQG